MDDHFWPAMYPGLIVGVLYGLALRGWLNTAAGAIGGVAGAAVAYTLLPMIGDTNDLISVAATVVLAFLGAYAAVFIAQRLTGSASAKP